MVLHTAPDSHSESETFMCLLLYAVCGSRVGCPLVPMLTGLVTAQLTRDELHMAFLPPSAPYHHRVIDKGRAAAPVRGPTAGPVRGCLYTSRSGEAASNKPLPHTAAPVCVAYTPPVAHTLLPSTRAAPPWPVASEASYRHVARPSYRYAARATLRDPCWASRRGRTSCESLDWWEGLADIDTSKVNFNSESLTSVTLLPTIKCS